MIIPKAILRAVVPLVRWPFFRGRRKNNSGPITPKRILLMHGAHIGDIVIATSILPILRSAFPEVEIGFMVGSWARMVVANHPEVAYIHCVDHWRNNRAPISFVAKVLQFRRTRRVALKEIRAIGYDVAVSLYPRFLPDYVDLGYTAKIPTRIAYTNGLFSSLATDLVDELKSPFLHIGDVLAEPLRKLGIDHAHFGLRKSSLPASDAASIQEVCSIFHVPNLKECGYRILHLGAGAIQREFPLYFWRELAENLARKHNLLFTGQGKHEAENIAKVTQGLPNCFNACDRLTWAGFVAAVRHAEVLYGVESMAGQVAGAVGTRCVVVYGGAAGVARWRPEGLESVVFTNHLPCAPCYLPLGRCHFQPPSPNHGDRCADNRLPCTHGIAPQDLIRLG